MKDLLPGNIWGLDRTHGHSSPIEMRETLKGVTPKEGGGVPEEGKAHPLFG
jgi:hypothetical protein